MTGPDADESIDSLSSRVIREIASLEGVHGTELEAPLFEVVDPDALDALFNSTEGHVTFPYHGYAVTVDAGGDISIEEDG